MDVRLFHAGCWMVFFVLLCTACTAPIERSAPSPASQSTSQALQSSSTHPQPNWSLIPGALVGVRMESTVGVVLDEIPAAHRERLVQSLLKEGDEFWADRARQQIRLTSLRLNFRNAPPKKQLPLPPEELWTIALHGPAQRQTIEGHDVIAVAYDFSGMLLSDADSPGASEPALGIIGGVWEEKFLLPVDPELIFQRTGFACMNESEFPPNSMDSEESDLFYDDRCRVEKKLSNTGCHQTAMPSISCVQAVTERIGGVRTSVRFERLPWDQAVAERVRIGTFTNPAGPDLLPYREEFLRHRFTYRYIPEDSCALIEQCAAGPGWRKLLMFPTADLNVGQQPLEIGIVDYFQKQGGSVLSKHGVFELSACHGHYHFSHYGSFTLGDGTQALTRKNGFCMQPTARLMNNELSPLHHPYVDCIDQGVSVGWIDEYKMGLECQWLDVTDVSPGQELPLTFTTNPDGLLCEGKLKKDAQGNQLFEATNFKTSGGEPVDAPQCDVYPPSSENNTESYDVRIPEVGESYVTVACGDGLFGPLRNCGFINQKQLYGCALGKQTVVRCSMPAGSAPQIVRICEGSRALQSGIPCTYNDALESVVLDQAPVDVRFRCPMPRGGVESGGRYSFLTAPLLPGDQAADVHCEAVAEPE